MSLTEFFVGVLFKRDEHGRSVFFPNGALGGGFIVPDPATERRIRDSMMRIQVGAAVFSSVVMTAVQGAIGGMADWRRRGLVRLRNRHDGIQPVDEICRHAAGEGARARLARRAARRRRVLSGPGGCTAAVVPLVPGRFVGFGFFDRHRCRDVWP